MVWQPPIEFRTSQVTGKVTDNKKQRELFLKTNVCIRASLLIHLRNRGDDLEEKAWDDLAKSLEELCIHVNEF